MTSVTYVLHLASNTGISIARFPLQNHLANFPHTKKHKKKKIDAEKKLRLIAIRCRLTIHVAVAISPHEIPLQWQILNDSREKCHRCRTCTRTYIHNLYENFLLAALCGVPI